MMYSIFKNACAGDTTLPKIDAYFNTKSSYAAWQKLYAKYYAKGDLPSYMTNCLAEIMTFSLTKDTVKNAETYISNIKALTLELLEANNPLNKQQKTIF